MCSGTPAQERDERDVIPCLAHVQVPVAVWLTRVPVRVLTWVGMRVCGAACMHVFV